MMPGFHPLDSHYILALIGLLLGVAVFTTQRQPDKTIWPIGIAGATCAHCLAYLLLDANAFDATGQYWPQHHFSLNGMFLGLSLPFLVLFDPSHVHALGPVRFVLYLFNGLPWGIFITWLVVRQRSTRNLPAFPSKGLPTEVMRLRERHSTKKSSRRGAPRA